MLAPIENLVRNLGRLPGLGRRSAGRAALALVREPERLLDPLVLALRDARAEIVCCSCCGAFTVRAENPCSFCTDATRDGSSVCVVEEPADIQTIESSGAFRGRYHVLGGKLSPVRRLGPEKLRIAELKDRVAREGFTEILLALSTDMEGDATAGYLAECLRAWPSEEKPVRVTRLAFGLPADSGVAYSDPLTLRRAIVHRCAVS
jgi:recombination protein RecR